MSKRNPKHAKKSLIRGILIKICILLFSDFLISSLILSNNYTYSWMSSNGKENMEVRAATTQHIIKNIDIENLNPKNIILTKADDAAGIPVIYFSAEGEAAQYISPINPIKLDTPTKTVSIKVNITLPKYLELINSTESIKGVIKIKYLNEFIDETKEMEFTREYLMDKCNKEMKEDAIGVLEKGKSINANSYLANLINYVAKHGEWRGIQSLKAYKTSDSNENPPVDLGNIIKFTEDQDKIIDIIAPGLKGYISEQSNTIKSLKNKLEVKNSEIQELKDQIKIYDQANQNLNANDETEEKEQSQPIEQVPDTTAPESPIIQLPDTVPQEQELPSPEGCPEETPTHLEVNPVETEGVELEPQSSIQAEQEGFKDSTQDGDESEDR